MSKFPNSEDFWKKKDLLYCVWEKINQTKPQQPPTPKKTKPTNKENKTNQSSKNLQSVLFMQLFLAVSYLSTLI